MLKLKSANPGLQTRPRHTSTTSSSFHFPPICSSLTPSFDFRIWHFSLIVLSDQSRFNLGHCQRGLDFLFQTWSWLEVWQTGETSHGNYPSNRLGFLLHSNYKGSLFNPLWATQRACSVKRANLLSNRISFSGTWLYCGSRSSF